MLITQHYSDEFYVKRLLIAIGILFFALALQFPGSFQAGDGIQHYLISRYSWKHPELFLDLWGKPFYTIISSTFSQFGLTGIKIFNALCAIFSCYFIFRISKKLHIPHPVISIFFLAFSPLYFFCVNSGYTEIFFGLTTAICIHEYLNKRYVWSTILISFLPFIRSEGYLILPLFFIILLINKKYINVLLLGTGNILYSLAGYFYYHDLFWLHTRNPYDGHMSEIYGRGPLMHFVDAYEFLWGNALTLLLVAGLLVCIFRILKSKFTFKSIFNEEVILIYGSLIVYFAGHSIFWWKGLFNSLGLERVMAAIMPLSAIICLKGLNFILTHVKIKLLQNIIITIFVFYVIITPFKSNLFPLRLDPEENVVLKLKDWYPHSRYPNNNYKVFYLHPFLPEVLSFDAYDKSRFDQLWGLYPGINEMGYKSIPDSTLVIWDAHYGPNESAIPLDKLMHDQHFQLVKSFYPDVPFNVLGNYPFEIHVFQKVDPANRPQVQHYEIKTEFENAEGIENANTISDARSYSGKKSCEMTPAIEFSAGLVDQCKNIAAIELVHCVKLNIRYYSADSDSASAVLSIHKDGKQTGWYEVPLTPGKKTGWASISGTFFPDNEILRQADYIKVYAWNKYKKSFFIDDLLIQYTSDCWSMNN